MKRVSKRQIAFRLGMLDSVKARIEGYRGARAVATVEGIECLMAVSEELRHDLRNAGALRARVDGYPEPRADGMPGNGDSLGQLPGLRRARNERRGELVCGALDRAARGALYEKFAAGHPVGSLVEAEVTARRPRRLRIRFACGLMARVALPHGYVDRWPEQKLSDVRHTHFPGRVEVIVRRVDIARQYIAVTVHGYPKDQKYCNAASGYRGNYDARVSPFAVLPWDRVGR